MRSRALIGFTGFVGSNLLRQGTFDGLYNSRNIEQIAQRRFDTVVCAGAPAAKWIANREPEADKASLERLFGALETVSCEQFVLISTIDVYPVLADADETFDCGRQPNHAYGSHRLWLEQRVRERFDNALIIRLPALFGPGLKKNVIFDLLHDNGLDAINPASTFQWYPLARLTRDIEIAHEASLRLVNLFTEPLRTGDIIEQFFPGSAVGAKRGSEAHYGLTTRHAELFGGRGGYVQDRASVMAELSDYLRSARAEGAR